MFINRQTRTKNARPAEHGQPDGTQRERERSAEREKNLKDLPTLVLYHTIFRT